MLILISPSFLLLVDAATLSTDKISPLLAGFYNSGPFSKISETYQSSIFTPGAIFYIKRMFSASISFSSTAATQRHSAMRFVLERRKQDQSQLGLLLYIDLLDTIPWVLNDTFSRFYKLLDSVWFSFIIIAFLKIKF